MEELVQRAMRLDTDAFLELMDIVGDQMYKTAWSILKNDADTADAVQDTIVTCYEKLDTLRTPQHFKTWMTRILLNKCYRIQEHYRKFAELPEQTECAAKDDGFADARFKELLSLTDRRYHLILTLYYADGFSVAEIADMLEMNRNTVKTMLARARDQIRRGFDADHKLSS